MNARPVASSHGMVATLAAITAMMGCGHGSDANLQGAGAAGGNAGVTNGNGGTSAAGAGGSAGNLGGMAGAAGVECTLDFDCPRGNVCYATVCEEGTCVYPPVARGTECEAGFCNGSEDAAACVPCVDDASGAEPDSGCPVGSPVCDERVSPPFCLGCTEDTDCNDGNECTTERCTNSICKSSPLPEGSECSGGICSGQGSCVQCIDNETSGRDTGCTSELPACDSSRFPATCVECTAPAECDDHNECTSESCEVGVCKHTTVFQGTPCTHGYCNGVSGMESCIVKECQATPECDDGIACTTDTCSSEQACSYTADHDQCADSGDVCNPTRCIVGAGCLPVDISRSVELLMNGDFEAGAENWTMTSVNYDQVIYPEDYIPRLTAYSEPNVAWLGGGEASPDEQNSLSQRVSVPSAAVSLTLSFFYQVHAEEQPDDHNHMQVYIRATEASQSDRELVVFYNQDTFAEWTWEPFSVTIDAAEWAGSDVVLEFSGTGIDGYSHFFVDSVSLVARVCEE